MVQLFHKLMTVPREVNVITEESRHFLFFATWDIADSWWGQSTTGIAGDGRKSWVYGIS